MKNYCVITTINPPTKAIEKLYELFGKSLIVVGDRKTPADWKYKDVQFILRFQPEKEWCHGYAPANHYARKNLGYLEAMRQGAELIYDTDDDNCPNGNWQFRQYRDVAEMACPEGWYNVYQCFTSKKIWPRGFSLKHLNRVVNNTFLNTKISSIQQGLADGEPDVDAIYRLTIPGENTFSILKSVHLERNTWCPFNSQSTWWFPNAFPLMYLPVNASFRMTDIWRSFVAQRCLWEIGEGVTFHSPSEVYQDRNEHDLLADFKDEIPGYLHNEYIVEILSALELTGSICDNMLTCYQAIVDKDILPEEEIRSLKKWIKDYNNIYIS